MKFSARAIELVRGLLRLIYVIAEDLDWLQKALEESSVATYRSRLAPFDRIRKDEDDSLAAMRYLRYCSEQGRAGSTLRGFVSALRWRHRLLDDAKNPAHSKLVTLALQAALKLAPDSEPKDPFELRHIFALFTHTMSVLGDKATGWPAKREAIFLYSAVLLAQRGLLRGDEVSNLKVDEVWTEDYVMSTGTKRKVLLLYLSSRKATPRKNKNKASTERKEKKEKKESNRGGGSKATAVVVGGTASIAALRVKWKKEAEKRLGAVVAISPDKDLRFCPLTWLGNTLAARDPTAEHLFHLRFTTKKVAAGTFRNLLQGALSAAGFDGKAFGMHSPRRGGATAAARNKLPMELLKRLGGWASDVVFLYLDADLEDLLTAADATLVSRTR